MKRRILSIVLLAAMCTALLAGCGQKSATWKVTCPWAPSGVAAMVSQQAATKSTSYSDTSSAMRTLCLWRTCIPPSSSSPPTPS